MDLMKLIDERHSVRAYQDKKLAPETAEAIRRELDRVNGLSGLHIQLIEDTEGVFGGLMTKLAGWKKGPAAYLALAGRGSDSALEEKCGYFGEYLVLYLQSLGLNTCWVGMFNRRAVRAELAEGERVVITVALGYGVTGGAPRKSKTPDQVTEGRDLPDWFRAGVACALKAPTAINQQKFRVTLEGDTPRVEAAGKGPFLGVDLGIVKYHFEVGSDHGRLDDWGVELWTRD